ncbi:MAG: dicarboxylate/amino acid:cation symporter [Clostridiales bacterium]|nr:dicarboxylate/amino acid:cation symporter [Clostridiales bacterium]
MNSWVFKKENLFIRIAIGFAIGILLGLFAPQFSVSVKIIGDIYLKLIKFMVLPVLICAVMSGIINSANLASLRRVALKTVVLYFMMFLASFAVSLGVALAVRPGRDIVFENRPVFEGEIAGKIGTADVLRQLFPSSLADVFSSKNILVTVIFAMLLSVIIVRMGDRAEPVKSFINRLSNIVFRVLSIIMETSPIGVMSLMAFSIAEYGSGMFMTIGKYILCCWLACIAVFIIVFLLPVRLYAKTDLKTFLRACGRIALMTMSTTSSAATLPTTLRVSVEDLGAPEDISSFTLPLGCTINMCGGACSFCCLALFVSDFYSLELPFSTLAMMAVVAALLNMAAPGIPGGGIVLMTSFLTIFGLPLDLIGPVAAFYRLLDMAFTTINVEGDVAANLIIAKSEANVLKS